MTSMWTLPQRRPAAIFAFFLVGLTAVFLLPFYFPVKAVVSDSYVFGFNNHVALAIFVIFAAAFAYWSGGLGLVVERKEGQGGTPMSRRLLVVTLGITAAVTITLWLMFRSVGAINEGYYLMDRLQHLAAGERMYQDFEFIYGPLVLYIPYALHRVLRLSLVDSYYLGWTLDWVVGMGLFWLTVKWSARSSPRKNGIYLLVFLGFIFSAASLGLNYTALRFASAPFFAAAVARLVEARRSVVPGALLAVVGGAWVLFLSPEQGIAFCLGTVAFLVLFVDRGRPGYLVGVALLAAADAGLFVLLQHLGVVNSMRGMAEGGLNLPLLPSFYIPVMLVLLVVAACVLVNSLRLRRKGGALEYMILVSAFALPAAFGRCDAGHMFMNTVGAYIAAWTVLSYRAAASRWMVWSYVLCALFLPLGLYQENNFFMFPVKEALFQPGDPHPALRRFTQGTLVRLKGAAGAAATMTKWRDKLPMPQPSDVPAQAPILAPLGYLSSLVFTPPLQPALTTGHYYGLANISTADEVQDKVRQLQAYRGRFLFFPADATCSTEAPAGPPSAADMAAADHQIRRNLFLNLMPFFVPRIRHHQDFYAPVCGYIRMHFEPTDYKAPLVGGKIWQRK